MLFNAGFMLVYLFGVVPVLKQHLKQSGLSNLKGLNQAKIIKKVILFLLLNMKIDGPTTYLRYGDDVFHN